MANITVQGLADFATLYTGAQLSRPRFIQAILYVINRVSADLRRISGGDINVARVSDLSEEVALDDQFETIYQAGLEYFLPRIGEWGRQAAQDAGPRYEMELARAQGQYAVYTAANCIGTLGNYAMQNSENSTFSELVYIITG
jgi:hypothetical protein